MCTAISFKTKDHYFGRNLDLEEDCIGSITITPRNYPFSFRKAPPLPRHFAIIGMAMVSDGYPLYYDATNELGLSMAGLLFSGHAHYPPAISGREGVSPFELIPFLLGQCATAAQARAMLARTRLAAIPFSDTLPLTPLHWIIADRNECFTVESMEDGLHVISNPIGVLTNNPPFGQQMTHLADYMALSPHAPENTLFPGVDLMPYSRGMGALGLPGDWSSPSRFVRAAFLRSTSVCCGSEEASVSHFFHMLSSVRHVRGSVMVDGKPEITLYSSCCNTDTGVYYYTTYENSRITGVDMRREDLDSAGLITYPLDRQTYLHIQNHSCKPDHSPVAPSDAIGYNQITQ